jgi:hypothetical protein
MALPVIRAGSEAFFRLEIFDNTSDPPVLFNPAQGVKITITDPAGTVKANLQAMTNESTGVYSYRHQTDVADVTGVWTHFFKSQDGSSIVISDVMDAFKLK